MARAFRELVEESVMNRRDLFGLFGTGVFAVRPPRPQEPLPLPDFSALDHIEFYVSDVEKSRDFLVRIFGNTLRNRNNKRYLKIGATYMAFELPRANSEIKVDHTSLAIKGLDMPRLHAFLQQRGIAFQDYPSGRDTAVVDPDGIRLQLSPENGWSLLNPATFLAEEIAMAEEPIFRPSGMDHLVLSVKEPEQSVSFYQKFLGAPLRKDNRIWFQAGTSRIGLQQTPSGQVPGVYYFCVKADAFNAQLATRRLQQIGAKMETPEVPGTVRFRDLDGLMIQVQ
jgi:catechol 2,3-dioxygenase-like lactoylglutathione lyase family enzyme